MCDSAFGAPPVEMDSRSDAYEFGAIPMCVFGSATALSCLVGWLMLALGVLEDGSAGDTIFRVAVGTLLIPTMYGVFLLLQITVYRRGLFRRDHARWVAAGRPDDWVPAARSQPRDLDFLYALIPTAISLIYIVTST
ncbi:hypothetical protein MHY85_20080 [Cellulomonas sp. ACRRI]|uniref:hypothetical protein n=1 Tax=Cellulomonas sp. ACRRI TaxID=2918188 RepID=UPI001EF2BC59|nr:hypothetical protein [Cellulomonas sp. ACRRI]MCG7288257.1 hypothetical protein [Cellulomonas sp. ACRRI]